MQTSGRMRRSRHALVAVVALMTVASVGVVGASPTAAAPYCGITWGSLDKTDPAMTGAQIFNLRSGRHDCYDRLVIDVGAGPTAGYDVRYVDVVRDDGSGEPVRLRGGAFIQLSVTAIAHDDAGNPTYRPPDRDEAVNVSGYQTLRQVRFRGDFEGVTTIGLGVRARLPFRVLVLAGPGAGHRVVIDVAHRWNE